jgi:hypothetical protein
VNKVLDKKKWGGEDTLKDTLEDILGGNPWRTSLEETLGGHPGGHL